MVSNDELLLTPYPYQQEAVNCLLENETVSDRSLLVMASGLGKTLTLAFYLKEKLKENSRLRVLFLCHNNDILEQCRDEFARVLDSGTTYGLFHGQEKEFKEVTILFASLQTMREWKDVFFQDEFDLIIVDEGHHGQAITFKEAITYFLPKHLIGMTATPDRMDGKDIREIFGEEIYLLTLPEALRKGHLSWISYRPITDNLNRKALQKIYDEVMNDGRRITMRDLNRLIFVRPRDQRIVEIIREHRQNDEQMIIFCPNVQYADYLWETFFSHDAALYHASLPPAVAHLNYENFRLGVTRILLAVDKFNEGIDIPEAELIVFLRSTKSKTIWLQQLGRGLRKKVGKEKVTVLDFVANCERIFDIRGILPHGPERTDDPIILDPILGEFLFTVEELEILDLLDRIFTPLYETYEEAQEAARRLEIRTMREYKSRYKEDPRLSSNPHATYKNRGWVSWQMFLREKPEFYETYEEAQEAARRLGILTMKEYKSRYKEDSRLPSTPHITYENRGWVSWQMFLREKPELHETYEEAQEAVRRLGILTMREYQSCYKEDPRLPSAPDGFYKNRGWVSWQMFLRGEEKNLYETYEEAQEAVRRLGILTQKEYQSRYKEDSRLPSDPRRTYKNRDWVSWSMFLRGEEKNLYETYEEAQEAVRRLGILTREEYQSRYKEDSRLPSTPSGFYKNRGWVSWPRFLRKR